jgi:hypothetical protein
VTNIWYERNKPTELGVDEGLQLYFKPFNAEIKSFRAPLPAEIFYWGF